MLNNNEKFMQNSKEFLLAQKTLVNSLLKYMTHMTDMLKMLFIEHLLIILKQFLLCTKRQVM